MCHLTFNFIITSALGNWSGKLRREERKQQLNPFKKEALKRIGFSFDPRQQQWEVFVKELNAFLEDHGNLPDSILDAKVSQFIIYQVYSIICMLIHFLPTLILQNYSSKVKEAGLSTKLMHFQQEPKKILGWYKNPRYSEQFTQNRIDVLTKAGLNWLLSLEQVNELKEKKGLIFPMPKDGALPHDGIIGLERHSWLTMFEALVEFKKDHGHTFVSPHNLSEELHHWVCEQRKKQQLYVTRRHTTLDKPYILYQGEMLSGINFVYHKPDIDWIENYERLVGKRVMTYLEVLHY